ncbi:MAG: alpha/beta fold hydrolase [Candidatus Aureabacteria bacterium]|nr:alpha/beta fold hydrolase [Candidatus Auribacterota bacterium]
MTWVWLIVAGAVVAYLGYFTVKYARLTTNIFLNSTMSAPPQTKWEIIGEVVKFLSLDGVELKGLFVQARAPGSAGTVVFAHEVGAGLNSYERYCAFLLDEGYNIFSFDFRGQHAEKKGNYNPTQWASENEYYDLLGALAYVRGRPDIDPERIVLFGVSRGATTALCILGRGPGIKAVVCDGAFSTWATIVSYIRKWAPIYFPRWVAEHLPVPIIVWLSFLGIRNAQRRLGLKLLTLEWALAQNRTVPVFIIHGKRDNYIDPRHACWIYDRIRSSKQMWIVEGARHNEAVILSPDEYRKRVTTFIKEYV